MKPTIGSTSTGERVGVDLRRCPRVFLIADPGVGKTTIARFLLRWWLAVPGHNARIFAIDPHEYFDLANQRPHSVDPAGVPPRWLTVIDGADAFPAPLLRLLLATPGPSVIATNGPVARDAQAADTNTDTATGTATDTDTATATGCTYLGLLPRHRPRSGPRPDPGQARLDWPVGIVSVVADTRGAHDFPRHRWANLSADVG